MTDYKIIESSSAKNTALAAAASERVINETTYSRQGRGYTRWNSFEFVNRDAVPASLRLDGQTTGAKVFDVAGGGIVVLEPEDGLTFDYADLVNIDGATAMTADAITVKANYKEPR